VLGKPTRDGAGERAGQSDVQAGDSIIAPLEDRKGQSAGRDEGHLRSVDGYEISAIYCDSRLHCPLRARHEPAALRDETCDHFACVRAGKTLLTTEFDLKLEDFCTFGDGEDAIVEKLVKRTGDKPATRDR
jgi:hypothetical protein